MVYDYSRVYTQTLSDKMKTFVWIHKLHNILSVWYSKVAAFFFLMEDSRELYLEASVNSL